MSQRSEAVPPVLRRVLVQLAAAGITQDFYLAGGTGLALLLSHRRSVDLDFFSRTNRLDAEERRALLTKLRRLGRWTLREAKDGTVQGRIGRVRVSFFWYPERLIRPLVRQGPIRIASMEDIGLMKIGAIIGRGSRKDFVDLYAICQQIPLSKLLPMVKKKFTDTRDFALQAFKALVFFEDAEHDPPLIMTAPIPWEYVKRFFTKEVRLLAREYLTR